MKKLGSILLTILWGISLIVMLPFTYFKFLSVRRKGRKYKKYNVEYLPEERYAKVYSLAKLLRYLTRSKVKEYIDHDKILIKPQLVIANHRSMIDAVLLFILFYENLSSNFVFVAKKELANSKIGNVLNLIDTIYIDRNNPREAIKALDQEKEEIKKGKAVIVFPEGTRNTSNELLEFKAGAFEPAYKTLCSIQPIVIANTNQYYEEKKQYRKDRKPILIAIMDEYKPVNFISIDRIIFAKNVQKVMQEKYNKMVKN